MLIAARVADAQTFAPVPPALSSGACPAEAPSAAAAACEGRGGAGGRGRDDGVRAEADLRDQLREWGFLMSVCGNVCALLPVYICMNRGELGSETEGRKTERDRDGERARACACVCDKKRERMGQEGWRGAGRERASVCERDVVLAFGFI